MGSLESTGIISRLSSDEPMDMAIRPLFREYLAERFVTTDPNGARDVQYAAAHAYLRRDSHVQAVRLAVATGDIDFIGNIVEACDPLSLFSEHGLERLRQIARLVPMSVARQRPRVGYVCAICWIKVGRLKDAQELYDVLEPVVTWSRIQSDTPDPAVLIERAFCHSMLAIYKGTPISEQDVTTLDTLSTCGREPSPQVSSMVATLRCYLLHHASAFREAKEAAHQSIRDAVTARSPYMEFFSYCELGMISGVEGATSDAFGFFEQVQRTCRATIRADERLALIRDAFKLELQHEIDPTRHSSVNRLRNICLRLPHLEGWLDVFAAVYRTYSEKLFLAGDLPAALAVLSVGIEHCSKQKIEGTPTILLAQRAFLLACAGRVTEAAGELTALHAGFANDLRCWRESEAFVEATAALDLVRGSCGPTSLLHDAIERAKRTGNVRSELRFRQLRWAFGRAGGVAEGLGDDDVNIRNLEARSGFRRAGVFVGRCLAAIESIDRPQISPVEIPTYSAGFLTPRQVSVLMKVNQGLADKSIAIELGISAHGVRYHLKRIYLKLHARDRQEACTKAGQLGIIRRPTDSFDSFRTTSAAEARP
jgi:LuxR family maltose regulon positive regulatory protein